MVNGKIVNPVAKRRSAIDNSILTPGARTDAAAQVAFVPTMVSLLKQASPTHQNILLRLLVPLLGSVALPTDPKEKEQLYGLRQV